MFEKPAKLRGHLLYLAESGGDPDAVLAGSGIRFSSIDALEPIATDKMGELFELLAARTPPDFAIRSGLATRFQYMGMLAYRLFNCGALREILEMWCRYSLVIGYPLASELHVRDGRWILEFRPRYAMSDAALRFCMESTLAGTAPAIGALTGHHVEPLSYGFPFRRPEHCDRYRLLGDTLIRFDQPAGFVTGPEEDLCLEITAIDSEAQAISEDYCQRTLARISGTQKTTERLQAILVRAKGKYPTAAEAAAMMGCAERTLQRQLAAEGCSYHRFVDHFRRCQAQLLLGQGIELKVVAYRLGFKDVGSLRRAFRQWTGHTPGDWRQTSDLRRGADSGLPTPRSERPIDPLAVL